MLLNGTMKSNISMIILVDIDLDTAFGILVKWAKISTYGTRKHEIVPSYQLILYCVELYYLDYKSKVHNHF